MKDAERRLRRLGGTPKSAKAARVATSPSGASEPGDPVRPAVTLGLGAAWQLAMDGEQPYHYAAVSVDLSIRVRGPLRLLVLARPALSAPLQREDGSFLDPPQHSVLVAAGVGPQLMFGSAVRPRVAAVFQIGPNTSTASDAVVLPGAALVGGLDIALGTSPLLLSPGVEVGFLGPFFVLRAGLQVGVAFGG